MPHANTPLRRDALQLAISAKQFKTIYRKILPMGDKPPQRRSRKSAVPSVDDSVRAAQQILHAIVQESDRGCVLVCAAWLEDLMRTIIYEELRFLGTVGGPLKLPPKNFDAILRSLVDGALGRATNRIAFFRLLRIVDDERGDVIEAIFRMRNEHFAHFAGVSRLNDRRLLPLLKKITKVNTSGTKNFTTTLPKGKYSKARRDFMDAFSGIVVELFQAMGELHDHRAEAARRHTRRMNRITRAANKSKEEALRRTDVLLKFRAELDERRKRGPDQFRAYIQTLPEDVKELLR